MMTRRVALVASLDAVPWIPLHGGLLTAVRSRSGFARAFRCGPFDDVERAEFTTWRPDAVLFPVCEHDAEAVAQWVDLARVIRAKCVLATFDDPYDHRTALALVDRVDAVLTPEANCLDEYRRRGKPVSVIVPPIDPRMHFPCFAGDAQRQQIHVAHVGGTQWLPRRTLVPAIRDACRRAGMVYGEIAGRTRWLAGAPLTRWLHSVRVLVDIPRHEYAKVTNPLLLPCSYTAPRVHIAAACGVLALVVDPRCDIEVLYPSLPVCTAEQAVEAALYWADDAREDDRRARAQAAHERWRRRWQPSRAPAQVIDEMLDAIGACEQGSRGASDPPAPRGSSGQQDPDCADAPAAQPASGSPPQRAMPS